MSNFPSLQGQDSKDKTRVWSVHVTERGGCGVIQTTYGLLGGKMIVNEREVCVGKNLGKKNETTPLQQAVLEARAAWIKTSESGYHQVVRAASPKAVPKAVPQASVMPQAMPKAMPQAMSKASAKVSCEAEEKAVEAAQAAYASCLKPRASLKKPRAITPKASPKASPIVPITVAPKEEPKARGKGINATIPLPMLAHDYHKRGKGSVFPCYVQPKLDGTRCIGIPQKGLFSRMRKAFPHLEHIVSELNQLPSDVIMDGELYTHELTFQEIVGLVKKETLREGNEARQQKIKYHVYDLVMGGTFEERHAILQALLKRHKFKHIVPVLTERCASEVAMKAKHNEYVAAGFEGIMLRNPAGLYKNSRSVDLLKYKEFMDEEFKVVGFTEGEGQEKGCVIWVCETEEGKRFSCRPRGTREERKEWFTNGAAYVGEMLTVRFQELSDGGVPRFPVGIAFRNYE